MLKMQGEIFRPLTQFILARNKIGLNKILGTIHFPTMIEANKYAANLGKSAMPRRNR